MGRANEKFDRQLFNFKSRELSLEMQTRSVATDKEASVAPRTKGGSLLINIVVGQLALLREWLEGVDRICREIWQTQDETVTPEFVREILVPEAMTLIGARVGATQSSVDINAVRTNRDPHAARHSLALKVKRLKSEIANRYEIEARELGRASQEFDQQFGNEWHEFHNRFMQLANEEERIERDTPRDRLLRAHSTYNELQAPETGLWKLSAGVNDNFKERFRTIAARAGRALGCPTDSGPEYFWFHRLYLDSLETNSDQLMAASKEGGMILRVCMASATFCSRLERKAVTGDKQSPTSQALDQRENLGDGILKKRARIVEIERILNRPPLTEYRGQPVHGGQNSRLRLEEERQHLLIAVVELEKELERGTAPRAQSAVNSAHAATERRGRLRATVYSLVAAMRMETYLESKSIGQTDFAATVGTTDRTLRSFRKTGKVRRDIFKSIAIHMGTTMEALLKE